MIQQEEFQLEEDGWILVKTYSDIGMKVQSKETGAVYDAAIDPKFTNREYEETDIPISPSKSENEEPYIPEPPEEENQEDED